jgi:NAD+ synthase (glutamine-hydrolysing)
MTLRLALAQFDFPVGDVAGNARRIAELIGQARDDYGARLVLFPELALSGYPPEDLLLRPSFLADCEAAIRELAKAATGIVAVVGWPAAGIARCCNARTGATYCASSRPSAGRCTRKSPTSPSTPTG